MSGKVVAGPSTAKEPNTQGCLHELASMGNIAGFIMVYKRTDGTYEHYSVGMDMPERGYAVAIAQENLISRIARIIE